jgi:tetratricopeptide (TPR) repeat protein
VSDQPSSHSDETGLVAKSPARLAPASASKTSRPRRLLLTLAVVAALVIAVLAGEFIGNLIRGSTSSRALAYDRQTGLADATAGQCADVVNYLAPVVSADPSDTASNEALGGCYVAVHDYQSAVPLLEAVAMVQPTLQSELSLATAAFFDGDASLIKSSLVTAIALSVTQNDHLSVAQAAQSFGLYGVGATALIAVPRATRTYAWYEIDAQSQLDLGNPNAAVAAARASIQLAPRAARGSTLFDAASVDESAGRDRTAVSALKQALAISPKTGAPTTYLDLSQCYTDLGQYPAALQATQSGVAYASGTTLFNLELTEATALEDLHHTTRAVRILTRLVANQSVPTSISASASVLLSTIEG